MKKYYCLLITFLVVIGLVGCSVKDDTINSSEQTQNLIDNNSSEETELSGYYVTPNPIAALEDYFVPLSNTESQAGFYYEIVQDNDIDYDFFNEPHDVGTTMGMRQHKDKYIDIWHEELDFSVENFKKLLNEKDRAEFEKMQENWENELLSESKFISGVLSNSVDYHVEPGTIFPLEMDFEYLRKVRERTLYVKYWQYCLEWGVVDYPEEPTVSFSYKSKLR